MWNQNLQKVHFHYGRYNFFSHKMKCSKIIEIAYYWLYKMPTTSIISVSRCSSRTVCSLIEIFRHIISNSLPCEQTIIGGEGVIVEIDETKMGKRKYNRGHRVEGAWVLGGVELTTEKNGF